MKNETKPAPCSVFILCITFIVFIVSSSAALAPYRAGKFTNSAITELAGTLGGELGAHLGWFADTAQLFTFNGHDGLPLQGYYIPAPISSISADPLPVLIHCAGWSETSIKYSKFLRILHTEGYPIYSFDLRGQGFSSATGFDKGVMTHVSSFKEYVDDLETFVTKEAAPRSRAVKAEGNGNFIYVANSMAALVGLTLQSKKPIFERLALVTPCIKPLGVPLIARAAIRLINKLGLGKSLLVRLPRDISNLKITHDPVNGKAWRDLRDLVPDRLVVQGPSVSFMRELVTAAKDIRKAGGSITAEVLILQAGIETFVENTAMGAFFSSLGSKSAKLVRFSSAYHEILQETPDIFYEAVSEIKAFLALSPAPAPASKSEIGGGPGGDFVSNVDSSALSYMLEL